MTYALYTEGNWGADLQVMTDTSLMHYMTDFLINEASLEEDMVSELDFTEMLKLFKDTLNSDNYYSLDLVWIVDSNNKEIFYFMY